MKNNIIRILKISFGNIIEWYDFCLYGYFANTIALQFFPDSNHFIALLATFAAFGVGFLARPLGGVLFGHLGDKIGRYYAMNLAIIFMSIPTMAMALLPTYSVIGIAAPIILVILRVVQGLSAGGQYSNLLTITTEEENFRFKGFHNGISYSVSVIGFVFAAVVSYIVITFLPQNMQSYAWRIPFGLSIILLICQFILRGEEHKTELKEFNLKIPDNKQVQKKIPLVQLLKEYKKSAIFVILLSTVSSSLYYLVITYFVTFTVDVEKLAMGDALEINVISLICLCLCVPLFGLLSDFIGRKLTLLLSLAVFFGVSFPVLALLNHHDYLHVLISTVLLAVLTAWVQGASTPFYTEIFPQHVRSSGCSVSYGIGVAIAGFAPMAATVFEEISFSGINYFFYILLGIGLVIAIFIPYKRIERKRLINLKLAGVEPISVSMLDIASGNKK